MSLRRTVTVTMAIAALALAGCGSSSETSLSPDTAPPLAPSIADVHARNGRVVITWAPNAEADLAGYNVYRVGSTTVKFNTSVLTTPVCGFAPGAPGVYRYRVTAVDRTGNESAPSPMVLVTVGSQGISTDNPDRDGLLQGR